MSTAPTPHPVGDATVAPLTKIVERNQVWSRMAAKYGVANPVPPWKTSLDGICDALDHSDRGAEVLGFADRRGEEDALSGRSTPACPIRRTGWSHWPIRLWCAASSTNRNSKTGWPRCAPGCTPEQGRRLAAPQGELGGRLADRVPVRYAGGNVGYLTLPANTVVERFLIPPCQRRRSRLTPR